MSHLTTADNKQYMYGDIGHMVLGPLDSTSCLDVNFKGRGEIMLSIWHSKEGSLMRGPDEPSEKDSYKGHNCLRADAN